jgi:hypothetical protein
VTEARMHLCRRARDDHALLIKYIPETQQHKGYKC